MKLSLTVTKWSIEPVFDFRLLEEQNKIVAVLARHDIGERRAERGLYRLVDGDLYSHDESTEPTQWWFYDASVRRWAKCDDPTQA